MTDNVNMANDEAQVISNVNQAEIPEVTEIESLCMNCHEDVSMDANTVVDVT